MELEESKILMLSTGLGLGGAEKVILMLAKYLKTIGIETFSYGLNNEDERIPEFHKANLSAESADMEKSPRGFYRQVKYLLSLTKEQSIQLIHAHMAHAILMACIIKLFRPSIKVISTMHSERPGGLAIKIMLWITKFFRFRDILFLKEHSTWYTSRKYSLIPNSPDDALFRLNKQEPEYFLFLGRLSAEKNPLLLPDIIAQCSNSELKLIVAGDGPQRKELEDLIAAKSLDERVECLGYVDNISSLFEKAIALIVVSEFEGFPLNFLEAGATGTTIISVDLTISRFMLKDGCGVISSVENMPNVLDELFNDRSKAERMGQNLKCRIKENFSQNVFNQKHLKLYVDAGLNTKEESQTMA